MSGPFRSRRLAIRALLAAMLIGSMLPGPRPALSQGTLSAIETDVDQIVRSARPSVVTVLSQSTLVRRLANGTTQPRVHTRVGSGVAVGEQLILTTASVVRDAERLTIRTTNGLQASAQVAGSDPISNLALLRVTDIRLPVIEFSSTRPAQAGEWVMAIGTSHYRAQITHSVGTIAVRHTEPRLSLLQLTNTVYPGYSGGAVLNSRGELIGIVQGDLSNPDGIGASVSFVMPMETVLPVYESLRREGRVRHGYLGVSTRAASVEAETEGDRVPIGALVDGVQTGGPAARAGLRRGDLIVAFDQVRVEYPEQLARWVAASRPGTAIQLTWVRDEVPQVARIVLSASPDRVPQWALTSAAATPAEESRRIADLERQIQKLNRELQRLKTEGGRTTR